MASDLAGLRPRDVYGTVTIDEATLEDSKSDKGAFLRMVEQETDAIIALHEAELLANSHDKVYAGAVGLEEPLSVAHLDAEFDAALEASDGNRTALRDVPEHNPSPRIVCDNANWLEDWE